MGGDSVPTLGDIDHDGDLDVVSGSNLGTFSYYENTGSAASPAFAERTGAANPLDGFVVPNAFSKPELGDLDGDLDLVAGAISGAFSYFENTSATVTPAFEERTGSSNPLASFNAGSLSLPALGDLDGDGDLDVLAQNQNVYHYFENVGDSTSPVFTERTGPSNPFSSLAVTPGFPFPVLGDIDEDGDLDLVAGKPDGVFLYYENTGNATSPVFIQRTGILNPLDGEDVGVYASPTLGDLDRDGDLDVVSGEGNGTFRTYYVPEPGHGMLLGAGITLLGLLDRLRGPRARE